MISHQNNFGTNLTAGTTAGVTTSPLNSIPTVDAPYYLAFDATNLNSHYEVVLVTSDTATNVNHAATAYNHTTAEEVRMVVPATELDCLDTGWKTIPATLTYSSADAPTYVCTTSIDLTTAIGVGMKIKLTHGGSVKYFIVTAIDATTITLYGGTDYTLAATAITLPFYSTQKAPIGFPLSPTKWTVEVTNTSNNSQASANQNAWYNTGGITISVPIGTWNVEHTEAIGHDSAGNVNIFATLSTANNSESDVDFTVVNYNIGQYIYLSNYRAKKLSVASKTSYYLNIRTTTVGTPTISLAGHLSKIIIRAVCAYL